MMNVDFVISISKFIEKSIPRDGIRTQVIYNIIDVSKFKYNKDLLNPNIVAIAQMQNPKYLYVGVLTYYKGINLLIKAFKSLLKEQPASKLFIVGPQGYGFNIEEHIKDPLLSKQIIYLGRISNAELGYLYDNIDVYTTASTWEGFNLPIVEAQLHGKPVVAFNIGSHEEVVRDQETGILVEAFNTEKFAEAMIRVYKERDTMGRKAKEWSYQFSSQNPHALTISDVIENWIN
jgi:1,2-diacylglycerol 3-alpha-glucosyltransferase